MGFHHRDGLRIGNVNAFAGTFIDKIRGILIPSTPAAILGDPAQAEKQIRDLRIVPFGFLGFGNAHANTLQIWVKDTETALSNTENNLPSW